MSNVKAFVIVAVVSLAAAGAVALASRTPGAVRADRAQQDAFAASHGARFTDDQIARHGAYRAPSYLSYLLALIVEIVLLVVLARGPIGRSLDAMSSWPSGWALRAAVLAAGVALATALALTPLAFVRGYAMEHAWGLSTQQLGGWLGDQGRSLLVGCIVAVVAALAFFGIVRAAPRTWWVWGWATFTVLTALLAFLWPVVIAPLFNRFTPLQDDVLAARIRAVAADAGVEVDRVLVADASRRSNAENAYVAGLFSSKRVVLFDTLLRGDDDDETMFVVAHELGHQIEDHVIKNVAIASVGLLGGFAALFWLSRRDWPWEWAGADGIGDLRSLPVLLLFVLAANVATLPAQSALSRAFERRADEIAISLTGSGEAATGMFRRLAFANLSDLRPPAWIETLLFSHPPIPERIEAVLSHQGDNQ